MTKMNQARPCMSLSRRKTNFKNTGQCWWGQTLRWPFRHITAILKPRVISQPMQPHFIIPQEKRPCRLATTEVSFVNHRISPNNLRSFPRVPYTVVNTTFPYSTWMGWKAINRYFSAVHSWDMILSKINPKKTTHSVYQPLKDCRSNRCESFYRNSISKCNSHSQLHRHTIRKSHGHSLCQKKRLSLKKRVSKRYRQLPSLLWMR